MIIDTLDNLEKYVSLNPLFKAVVDFLKSNDLNNLEPGKHLIKDTDVFVNVQTAKSKTRSEAVFEYHRKYVDIQIPLSCNEEYGFTPLEDLPEAEFNEEKDVAKVAGLAAQSYVVCRPGMFAIFMPQDGHAPCISSESEIRKVIFKVKV